MPHCSLQNSGLLKLSVFCAASFVFLSLNFYTNFLHIAEQSWFASFNRDCESFIIGRLIKSRQDGIFSTGGLPVFAVTDEAAAKNLAVSSTDNLNNYDAYINNIQVEHFSPPYYSQICGQGMFYSIIDKYIPCAPSVKLRIFHATASALTAIVLTVIIGWFSIEFGFFAGTTVLISAIMSQWLTVFARNLWWSTWAFYLPMAMVMLYFLIMKKSSDSNHMKLGSVIFFSLLIKLIFNGYEYITATLIMMMVPFVYYCLLNKVELSSFFRGLAKSALGAGLAIGISICILSFQIAAVTGNFKDGFDHIVLSFQKRTYANPGQFQAIYSESFKASTVSVVHDYLKGEFYGFSSGAASSAGSEDQSRYSVTYAHLILFFALMTLLLYLSEQKNAAASNKRMLLAFCIATWFSILAPLSWFIIFKAHSYIHTHLNFIVWQMPFTFFGAALAGLALRSFFSRLRPSAHCSPAAKNLSRR